MPVSKDCIEQLDAFVRAANFLGAAQIYLHANTRLTAPLAPAQIKPRLLGHWGTQPGLNLIYAHMSRLVRDTGAEAMLMVGPGHGAPAILACLWLEGTLGETYPDYACNGDGMAQLIRAFSWPGGFPSHLTALTPGTIHEGGELGYSMLHAFGAVLDNPELLVACVVGDGEAETGPLAGSWHCNKFLDPLHDGAVLPILHLNGVKLSGPAFFARMTSEELAAYFRGCGWVMREVVGETPREVHAPLAEAMDWAHGEIRRLQQRARNGDTSTFYSGWPLIVLRTPKGMTGPASLDGKPVVGTFRSHQVPIVDPRTNPAHLKALEAWLRSYRSEELFDAAGKPVASVTAILPPAPLRLGRSAHANGGVLKQQLALPGLDGHAVKLTTPGTAEAENTGVLGGWLRDVFRANPTNFRLFCPDETNSNHLGAVFEATSRAWDLPLKPSDVALARGGRVMEILSEHCCEGWLEGYLLSGRHGVLACYEAFIGIIDTMMGQYAKWQKMAADLPWRKPVASLNYLLTSHVWEQDHNGYSHQGPTFINTMMMKKASEIRIYLPPDANCLLSTMQHCLASEGYLNLIVASKKPQWQWLDLEAAKAHCARGASIWEWVSCTGEPDVVLAAAGDIPTRETIAAASLLHDAIPDLKVRVVNVVDLLTLESKGDHPHGMDAAAFAELFTEAAPVVFAFHGYPLLIHELIYRRPDPGRFHVKGYNEEGTTTTPFDMLVVNGISRYHIAIEALHRAARLRSDAGDLIHRFETMLAAHKAYIVEHGEDMPEIAGWRFSPH
ncbi:MAG TPA: phosphoketolase family protein [Acetobacteraceae bacterium]|nr:phosphoketolase family protein [Acetobacteraceae bacterium]